MLCIFSHDAQHAHSNIRSKAQYCVHQEIRRKTRDTSNPGLGERTRRAQEVAGKRGTASIGFQSHIAIGRGFVPEVVRHLLSQLPVELAFHLHRTPRGILTRVGEMGM